jgi:signal transduction histidine kinase
MIYLLVLAYIFGYISEFEKKQNQKLMALYKTASEVATQEERKRIARELHDRLLQVLGSLTLRLEACRRHLLGSTKELEAELALMEESTRSSIQEIRSFLSGKVIEPFTPGTLLERVREEMRFLRDGLGLRVILDVETEDLALAPQVECELYYVLREGLMNIARHAQASKVQIHLRQVGSEIQGSLEDDGIGFDVAKLTDSSYGLSSMRERIQRAGGRFSVESSPGNGTTIAFRVPTLVSGEEWKEIGGGHGEERRNRD